MSEAIIKKNSITDQICQILQEKIISREYPIGSKLPSENDLAKSFNVSRLSVRLAIQKLNVMGALETKQGSGTYVKQFNYEKYLSDASILFEQSGTMDDVSDFRAMLEPACAVMAMENATEEDFEILERLCKEHYKLRCDRNSNWETWLKNVASADVAIHEHICKMSHNRLCIYAFAMAKESIYQYILFCLFKYNPLKEQNSTPGDRHDVHFDIYRALKEKDQERCRKDLLKMIYSYSNGAWSMPPQD